MKILILGGSGFIGSNLVDYLLSGSEKQEISILSRNTKHLSASRDIHLIQGDYKDRRLLQKCIQNQDLIYHCVSETFPFSSWESPKDEVERNLLPFIDFIELFATGQEHKLVFLSSGGTVYGYSETGLKESDKVNPYVPYGIIKLTMEYFLNYAYERFGLKSYLFRISNVFGPGQNTAKGLGFVNTLLDAVHQNKPIHIYGDGWHLRDYIFINDVCSLLAPKTLESLVSNEVYNMASGEILSQNAIVDMVREMTGMPLDIRHLAGRKSDVKSIHIENSKLMRVLPDFRFTPFREALLLTYQKMKSDKPGEYLPNS